MPERLSLIRADEAPSAGPCFCNADDAPAHFREPRRPSRKAKIPQPCSHIEGGDQGPFRYSGRGTPSQARPSITPKAIHRNQDAIWASAKGASNGASGRLPFKKLPRMAGRKTIHDTPFHRLAGKPASLSGRPQSLGGLQARAMIAHTSSAAIRSGPPQRGASRKRSATVPRTPAPESHAPAKRSPRPQPVRRSLNPKAFAQKQSMRARIAS